MVSYFAKIRSKIAEVGLAMRGESVLTIRDLLGHSDTRMASRYSHLAASHLLRAAESVSDSFPVNPEIKVGRKVGVN